MAQATGGLLICTLFPFLCAAGGTGLFAVALGARTTALHARGMAALAVVFAAVGGLCGVVALVDTAVAKKDVLAVEDYTTDVAAMLRVPAAMIALMSRQRVLGRVALRALLALEHGEAKSAAAQVQE